MANLNFPNMTSIVGSCGSGKTYSVKYMLLQNRASYDYVIVVSPTNFTGSYDFLKTYNIPHKLLSPLGFDIIIKFLLKKQIYYYELKKNCPRIVLVLDDCSGAIRESKILKKLVSTHRHYGITIWFVAQYGTDLPPRLRELTYYAIVFNQNTEKSLRAVHETYFREIGTFKDFVPWFSDKLKEKYTFFFVDRINNKKSVTRCP
jgi:hypothetical protein